MRRKDWLPAALKGAGIERPLRAGQFLFKLGQRTLGLYEIVSGKVRLARVDRAGRETVLYVASAGDSIAEASLFATHYHCDAIAVTDAVVRLYPKAAILAEFQRRPAAGQAFAAMLAREIMSLRTRLERRNIHSARERIRHFLVLNAAPDGRSVVLPGTLKDIALDLGLTHEALYRALAAMAADGEIERLKGAIRLRKLI